MNNKPGIDDKVSIIVPVHNARDYIANTIKMVEAQTYTNWELVLVDDASTDDSVEIITSAIEESSFSQEHFVLILKNKNEKAAAARNTGLDRASGRYIAFLDADDVWLPEKLQKELEFMKKERASFVFMSYEFGDEDAKLTGKIVRVPDSLDFKHALSRTVIFTSTTLFDTKHLDKKLIYMPLIESEDTATWWSILKTGVIARGLDEPLVIYRRPAHSLSSNKLVAIKRIWRLYREIAKLNVFSSLVNLVGWAYRATVRRI
ncbi:teichuronic acid biosynthesis glycosyltransferase TuaG [Butyrivibrio fibrisolvens DSM 3071]|uniref:Teichuronic acid biosynthesis glycosyltransferase TuaG n=1 Tax=Butyrivibrio fibrisolvens DSM 3071 TaxID=1121131 RepID=A0A1M5ZWH3_BUTFI|nr:glycosyltransferase family 2 protein [Butyrivibrio fibrisolvens]SHI28637.1 teichuronic acid biosynthesis glycosyltransferase TuaG [Butyrivibrio fibrisolvens DSM 3071]